MSDTTPETFDIDAWLKDAHLPEDSCVIYKRPDVIAELTSIQAEIDRLPEDDQRTGKTLGEKSPRAALEARYEELLETFSDSKVTVYVRAIPPVRRRELLEDYKASKKDKGDAKADHEQGLAVVAESIAGIAGEDGKRHDVKFTVDQVRKLEGAIGGSQLAQIQQALHRAQNQAPVMNVDFLSQYSGISKTATSD